MTDNHDSYFFAIRMMRLRLLITGAVWAEPEETFDLVMAAMLARLPPRT